MVKGLDLFRERFRDFEGSFTLIGGAACDEWFTAQGLRVTTKHQFPSVGGGEMHVEHLDGGELFQQ